MDYTEIKNIVMGSKLCESVGDSVLYASKLNHMFSLACISHKK